MDIHILKSIVFQPIQGTKKAKLFGFKCTQRQKYRRVNQVVESKIFYYIYIFVVQNIKYI